MNTIQAYSISKLGTHRGAPRVWLQGSSPARGGFTPGARYRVTSQPGKTLLTLELAADGDRTVSRKAKGDEVIPVIDINGRDILAMFAGLEAVRVVVEIGKISILPIAAELRARERLQRLKEKLQRGRALLTGSTATGAGILDRAAHEGLLAAGVASELAFANEVREDCMEHAVACNPVFTDRTLLATAPMQHLVIDDWIMDQLPQLDVLHAGLPCSAASRAGRAKNKLAGRHPESHPSVGHLVVAFLGLVAKTNPVCVVLENTPIYKDTASMDIVRNQLRDLGYDVHETVLASGDWNMLEHRERLCMVAVTRGIQFDLSSVEKPQPQVTRLASVLDDVAGNDPRWGTMSYLKDKRERDAAKGSNFKMFVVTPESTRVGAQTKHLWKRQSTGTFVLHPTDPDLLRIPTVAEHARFKGVWTDMVEGVGLAFGHEMLGQSISVPPWRSVFKALGQALKRFAADDVPALTQAVRMRAVSA